MKARFIIMLGVIVGFCGGGCMTGNLWHETDYVVPAPEPKLALSQTPKGILVQYDAMIERTGKIHRRCYLLEPNLARLAKGRGPVPFKASKGGPQTPILLFRFAPADRDYYAIVATNLTTFTIHRRGNLLGPCDLPVYKDREVTAAKWAFTPLTVAADASVVGGVVGAVFYAAWKTDGEIFENGIFPLDYSQHGAAMDPVVPP